MKQRFLCSQFERVIMWIALAGCAVLLVLVINKYVFGGKGPNPFAVDSREPLKPIVTDKKERNKVLKQGFLASKVPDNLDAIVIGSGVGGLGVAVLLAKVGKRVLVLEQHDRAGGCCHTFSEKGFEFDVGIHYIGELKEHSVSRCLVDQVTNGQLQWEPLCNPYDQVILGPPENRRIYPIYSGKERFLSELKKCFPGEEAAIDKYCHLFRKTGRGIWMVAVLKLVPVPVSKFLVYTGLAKWLSPFFAMASRSVTEVVNELTENKDLRAVFSYIFGTYGNIPKESSFAMHSLLMDHFLNGAWYPKGGASQIAYHMIPIIEKAGGAVLVRAHVNRILVNDAKAACGVSVIKGQEEVHIHAPIIISDAGIINTYSKLLPKDLQSLPGIQQQLDMVKSGSGGFSMFIGLRGSKEELGLQAVNHWIFKENNFDELAENYLNGSREESAQDMPMFYVASPSSKDPTWEQRKPGTSTLSIVGYTRYEWFEEWKDDKVSSRGLDYKGLKQAFIDSMLEKLVEIYPKIKDKIEYIDAGTPLTNQYYFAAPRGEFYGCDHGLARLTPEYNAIIRSQTPVKNLYLTGQDVFLCGFAGALAGALVCGSVILNRTLFMDVVTLAKKLKSSDNHKKTE